jgi:hypothetical protein
MTSPRQQLLAGLERDLIGPQAGDTEVIQAWPGDQYITGILYPPPLEAQAADDEDEDAAEDAGDSPGEAISMASMRRPNMMGISFAVAGASPILRVRGCAARYLPRARQEDGKLVEGTSKDTACWVREPLQLEAELEVTERLTSSRAAEGLTWWVRGLRTERPEDGEPRWQVTVVLTNDSPPAPGRFEAEKTTFFQVEFEVRAASPARLVPRRSTSRGMDEDALSNAVIYRKAEEWAVGHICSATWDTDEGGSVVRSAWIPTSLVRTMTADGHRYFREESTARTGSPEGAFQARLLAAQASPPDLGRWLETIPAAYERWLLEQEQRIPGLESSRELSPDLAAHARRHIDIGRDVVRRLREGITILVTDEKANLAFRLAQEAMTIQRRWSSPASPELYWRPFQLAFQLLTVGGIARPSVSGEPSPDRLTMDLLWFPTGGGKTEAYLGLTAFTLFLRRLRGKQPDDGAGVAVIMRYTLRLLTVQQFERAARLVIACDHIRRTRPDGGKLLGKTPFAIGLWVGSGATANTLKKAETAEEQQRAQQLARCPACSQPSLQWIIGGGTFEVHCTRAGCDIEGVSLGVWTIDEVIYQRRPGLLIGTIDKFAQIVRNQDTNSLFSGLPPELIIQDELHLISGPLGTVAGVYEAAIDMLCTHQGIPPKVVGSTATIRRAGDQVRQLFNRGVMQFPPPVLDIEDSCFAVVDCEAPGRLYAGVTTSGRSPKFILQAVCASLMQWAFELPLTDDEKDPYWTLVAYFNSLRELGGALVMMQDDVQDSVLTYSRLHGSAVGSRPLNDLPLELTSRVDQAHIPLFLVDLERRHPHQPVASVLATNMISVGVDIPRLGLMVVNGQPKGMAEYIQATSRVGRGNISGLVVTVYNAGRPRDRSHYEAFRTWHQTLYREVEATSVTPFAPRARDRALHAAIVALARHKLTDMLSQPELTPDRRRRLEHLVDALVHRTRNVDPDEALGVRADASRFLDSWEGRTGLKTYWSEFKPNEALLVSLETVAAAKATVGNWRHAAVGTPNSMRNVEAETMFQIWEAPMRTKKTGGSDA